MSNKSHIRIALDTLGCKLNQAETESLSRQFAEAGCQLVSPDDGADIYILNTCTVTHIADRKARQWLRQVRRRSPEALIIATGCYAHRAPKELAQIDDIDLVVNNWYKRNLLALLEEMGYVFQPTPVSNHSYPLSKTPQRMKTSSPLMGEEKGEGETDSGSPHSNSLPQGARELCAHNSGSDNQQANSRTRAFIKVQDGCSQFCAYCIVPLVRGKEISRAPDRIIADIKQRVSEGYKEVVLTGTEIGAYHSGEAGLKQLVERVLAETGVSRLRLTSLQPHEITHELLDLWQDSRLCRHFHIALQSGSDSVLQRMKRRYTTGEYQRAVSLVRNTIPEVAITTDVIVGFPGETEEEFQQSYDFCREIGFARIHVFPYSPRPDTEAARMPGQVSEKVKGAHTQKMLALAEESARSFHQQFLGKTMTVLWEKKSRGLWSGYTDNYIKVYMKSSEDLSNRLVPVKVVEIRGDGVWGEVMAEE